MNGEQLKDIINSTNSAKKYFKGIYSINTLPKNLSTPSYLICNYDFDKNPGTHWFCLFKTSATKLECFDSLGLTAEKQKILKSYIKIKNIDSICYNQTQVQNTSTSTCGKFVLYFAIQRLHNLDLDFTELLNEIFEENVDNNEIKVMNFLHHLKNE